VSKQIGCGDLAAALLQPCRQRRWHAGRAVPFPEQWLACIGLVVAAKVVCLVCIWRALLRSKGLHVPSAVSGVPSPWGSIPASSSRAIPFLRTIFHIPPNKGVSSSTLILPHGWVSFSIASDSTSPSCKCSPLGSLTSTTTTQARACSWAAATACCQVSCCCRGTNCYCL